MRDRYGARMIGMPQMLVTAAHSYLSGLTSCQPARFRRFKTSLLRIFPHGRLIDNVYLYTLTGEIQSATCGGTATRQRCTLIQLRLAAFANASGARLRILLP
jgi:hypothetical protein